MNNQIKFLIGGVLLIALGFLLFSRRTTAPTISDTATGTPITAPAPSLPPTLIPNTPSNADLKQEAWNVLQKYLAAAKAHDLKALAATSYQVSDACQDPAQQTECFKRMDSVVALGATLKQADFKNIISDTKQIILSTDYKLAVSTDGDSYSRGLIYFARQNDGTPQLLYFFPKALTYNIATASSTPAETLATLKKMIIDTDGDTLDDEVETCSYYGVDTKTCVKTDPLKRDTNGNGWWDSIEILFYKNTGQ